MFDFILVILITSHLCANIWIIYNHQGNIYGYFFRHCNSIIAHFIGMMAYQPNTLSFHPKSQ